MWNQLQESWHKLIDKLLGWFDGLVTNLPNIFLAIFIGAVALYASRYVKKGILQLLSKATNNKTVTNVLANIFTAIFLLFGLFIVLGILNLDKALTSLLAGAGVIGLAVGLALQDPLINLFSGVLMSVRDYYKIGDLIETNSFFGTIQKINLRSTILMTPDGQEVIIPNKEVLQSPLVNFSHNGRRRIDVNCGVAYGDDLENAKQVALQAVKSNVEYDDTRPVELFYGEFGDSSVNFVLQFWHNTYSQKSYLETKSQAIIAIKKAFDKNGITIPFPIRTLDFGVVGGERLDELYPFPRELSSNGNHSSN
ncbi:MAG: mechanosensitive ion channel family protein [Bacteroidota bacterium]